LKGFGVNKKHKKYDYLHIIGETKFDNNGISRQVIGGCGLFKFVDSLGYPLDLLLEQLEEEKCIIDWVGFVCEALRCGWNKKTILSKIIESVNGVYKEEGFAEKIITVIDYLLKLNDEELSLAMSRHKEFN
jgi:hypothetical protein